MNASEVSMEPARDGMTIVYAGGGTGGHIFPALAVCERVREARAAVHARFLCSTRAIDARILSGAKVDGASAQSTPIEFSPIHAFPAAMRPMALYRFISHWGMSVRESRRHLRELKTRGPVVVAAFGGFVAAPVVQAARVEGVPVLMVNLDAVPGKANLWIEKRVNAMRQRGQGSGAGRGNTARIVTSAEVAGHPSWTRVGPIVRKVGLAPADAATCRRELGLDPNTRTLMITGGSQGAASINDLVRTLLELEPNAFKGWQVVHQCGGASGGAVNGSAAGAASTSAKDADLATPLREAYAKSGVQARVEPFFEAMGLLWGSADVCVSRAGAGAVAEAWANRVATVFMPYPYHKDQHQRVNAKALVEAGGAVLAKDAIDPRANAQGEAGRAIIRLLKDDAARASLRDGLATLGPADGATRVAAMLIEMLDGT